MKPRESSKKLFAILLSICMLVSVGAVTFAATRGTSMPVQFGVSNAAAQRGDEITVQVTVSPNSDLSAMDLRLSYDSAMLENVSVGAGKGLAGGIWDANAVPEQGLLLFTYAADDGYNGSGAVLEATFRVREVAAGKIPLTLEVVTLADSDLNDLQSEVSQGSVTVGVPMESIELDQTSLSLKKGESRALQVSFYPANTTEDRTVGWSSNNTQAVVVDESGLVKAVGEGNAVITATATNGSTAQCAVTVGGELQWTLALDKAALALEKGQSETLRALFDPADAASGQQVAWSSSNTAAATVDQNGVVTAVGSGSAVITAAAGGQAASCAVTVTAPLQSIAVKPDVTLLTGTSETLAVTYSPADTTDDRTAEWSSNAPEIAAVDQNGAVKALRAGTAEITVRVGMKTATSKVTVTEIPLGNITLNRNELTLEKGQAGALLVAYHPENTTDSREVHWSSDKPAVAAVDAEGNVQAVGAGTAVITAQVGDSTASCTVTVTAALQSISLNKSKLDMKKEQTETLTIGFQPADTTDDRSIGWSSSDKAVATVDANGVVTAVGGGSAVITAQVGGHTASCEVFVSSPLASISVGQSELSLGKGDAKPLWVVYHPGDTTDSKTVRWSSSDETVATVDANGTVTALAAGTAVITAQVGDFTATCTVTVTDEQPPAEGPRFEQREIAVKQGAEARLALLGADGAQDVSWVSSDTAVVEILSSDETGARVWALRPGTAVVSASADGRTASIRVTVTADGVADDPMENIPGENNPPPEQPGEDAPQMPDAGGEQANTPFTGDSAPLAWTAVVLLAAFGVAGTLIGLRLKKRGGKVF